MTINLSEAEIKKIHTLIPHYCKLCNKTGEYDDLIKHIEKLIEKGKSK